MTLRILLPAAIAVVISGCGASESLADADPKGAEACAALAQALGGDGDPDATVRAMSRAAQAGADATTRDIRSAVIDTSGKSYADPELMQQACVSAGVEVPPVPIRKGIADDATPIGREDFLRQARQLSLGTVTLQDWSDSRLLTLGDTVCSGFTLADLSFDQVVGIATAHETAPTREDAEELTYVSVNNLCPDVADQLPPR